MASSSSLLLSIFVVGLFLVSIEVDGSPRVAFSKFTRVESQNIPDAGTPAPIVPTPVKPTFKHLTSQYGVRSNPPPPPEAMEDDFYKFSDKSFVQSTAASKPHSMNRPTIDDEKLDEKAYDEQFNSFTPNKVPCGLSCTTEVKNQKYYSKAARMTNMFSPPSSVPPIRATMTKEQLSENEMALYYESINGQTPEIVGTQQNIPPPPPLITTFDSMKDYHAYKARMASKASLLDEDLAYSDP